ncbi:hypothetical protein [Prosthecobacter sp.]|uniref:hypothetical protein n=1 Tax=Prosthecobacter sp. TaxID=1965333 RepID=UPI00378527DE
MSEFIRQHSFATGIILVSLVVSLRLVFGLWLLPKFTAVPWLKKLSWSFVALLPLIGPLFYAAFFQVPHYHRAGDGVQPGMPGHGWSGY